MHTQRETASHIVEGKRADYLLTTEESQPTLHADNAALSDESFPLYA